MTDGRLMAVAARQSQIAEQVQLLDKAISRAGELRQRLEERICGILRNGAPTGEVPKPERQLMVPLAEELATLIARVDGLSTGLDDLLQRVEL